MSDSPLLGGRPLSALTGSISAGLLAGVNQVARGMGVLGVQMPQWVAGTITTDYATFDKTQVALDTDPGQSIGARSFFRYAKETRVLCVIHPPRGVIVLGAFRDDERGLPVALTRLRILANNDVSPTSESHPFQIGSSAGQNIRIDTNEIMAVTNGVPSILNFQNNGGTAQFGGSVQSSTMRHVEQVASGNVSTVSVTPETNANSPDRSFTIPSSGEVTVFFSADTTNSGAGFSTMTVRVRQDDAAGAILFTGGADERILKEGSSGRATLANFVTIDGLPPDTTGWVEGLYSTTSGTATFRNARLSVIPSP